MNVKSRLAAIVVSMAASADPLGAFAERIAAASERAPADAPVSVPVGPLSLRTEERSATSALSQETVRKIEKNKERMARTKKEPFSYRAMMLLHSDISQP
jgi:hypothetical protein